MMVYYYDFLLYLCVDICYDRNELPYNVSLELDTLVDREGALLGKYPNICSYCSKKWRDSPVGNASEYTNFFFFSRKTGLNYTEILPNNISSFVKSGFDMKKDTKLLVHGWVDNATYHFPAEVRDAYLAVQDVNIIAVDWSRLAKTFYPVARVAVDPVGRYVAQFLNWLVSEIGVPMDTIHIIGHSLGAHIAGVAGEHVTCGALSRISGLDPAGPGFDSQRNGRLDSTDAQFVDVIHTSGWWAGYFDPLGAVDFYPNGGIPNQPGCPLDWGKCSHIRSYKLFAESISSDGFVAKACNSWWDYKKSQCDHNITAIMGEHVDLSTKGKFYLRTAGHYPYALGNNTDQYK